MAGTGAEAVAAGLRTDGGELIAGAVAREIEAEVADATGAVRVVGEATFGAVATVGAARTCVEVAVSAIVDFRAGFVSGVAVAVTAAEGVVEGFVAAELTAGAVPVLGFAAAAVAACFFLWIDLWTTGVPSEATFCGVGDVFVAGGAITVTSSSAQAVVADPTTARAVMMRYR